MIATIVKKPPYAHCMCTHVGHIHYPATCTTVSRAGARINTTIKCVVIFICCQTAASCKLLPYCAVYHGTGIYRLARPERPDVYCLRVNVGLGRRFRHEVCVVSNPCLDCRSVL